MVKRQRCSHPRAHLLEDNQGRLINGATVVQCVYHACSQNCRRPTAPSGKSGRASCALRVQLPVAILFSIISRLAGIQNFGSAMWGPTCQNAREGRELAPRVEILIKFLSKLVCSTD